MTTLPARIKLGAAVDRRGASSGLTPTESVYGIWSRYCLQYMPAPSELRRAFAPHSCARPIFSFSTQWDAAAISNSVDERGEELKGAYARAAHILGITRASFYASSGLQLAPRAWRKAAMCQTLRACWCCMRLGLHSVLFQHYGLRCCPFHSVPLSTKCPKCQADSLPTFISVAASPFGCQTCGELWVCAVRPESSDDHVRAVGQMLAERERELGPVPATLNAYRSAAPVTAPCGDADGAKHSRQVVRLTVWPPTSSELWPRFYERRYDVVEPRWDDAPCREQLTARMATSCLLMLSRLCCREGHDVDALKLRSRLSLLPRGMCVNDSASVVAVALHQTMCIYAKNASTVAFDEFGGVYRDVMWNGIRAGNWLPNSDDGNALLIRSEILGWFAICVIHASRFSFLADVRWPFELPKASFLPAWQTTKFGANYLLRVRERASEMSIQRLVRRYPPTARLIAVDAASRHP